VPLELINSSLTSHYNIGNNDTVFLAAGVQLTSENDGFDSQNATVENINLFVMGEVLALRKAVDFFGAQTSVDGIVNTSIVIGASGSLFGLEEGIYAEDGSLRVTNHGSIYGDSNGIRLAGGGASILNTGTLSAGTGQAIRVDSGGTLTTVLINNTGIISTTDVGGEAIDFVAANGVSGIIHNTGQIIGNVNFSNGNILADLYQATGNGVVIGRVSSGAGSDTLVGGDLADQLDAGANDDIVVGRAGNDTLVGGTGLDNMVGGSGDDSMDGGADADTINGNDGSDHLFGDTGNDLIVGQNGSDFLDGGGNDDTLDGGNGDDVLEGGDGNDILRGRNGEDELAGGLGRDFLTGGLGADNFVFRALAETVVGANRDQILDLEQGVDLIVVAGLSPGVFEFRGTAAFAPSGNPELRVVETATGSTIVQIDGDGNGVADAEIRVGGVTGLTADDFVL
jgi:serralysin